MLQVYLDVACSESCCTARLPQCRFSFRRSPKIACRVLGELLTITWFKCCHVPCVGARSQRVVRELPAIFDHISILILSIILTAPHSEVLPKSLAGCWENYGYHTVHLLACTLFWFLESESRSRVSMEMAQVNSCHVFQF